MGRECSKHREDEWMYDPVEKARRKEATRKN
jgi:hypothetical protein